MATHFSILPWRIPWTEKPGGLQSIGPQRVVHYWVTKHKFFHVVVVMHFVLLHACMFSYVWLFVTAWTVACQAPLSMEISRQEYWSGFPFPSPGDLSNPVNKSASPAMRQILYHLSHQESDLMDCNPPGCSVRGILQARIMERVAIPFSKGSSWPKDQTRVSCTAGRFFSSDQPEKAKYFHRWNYGEYLVCSEKKPLK